MQILLTNNILNDIELYIKLYVCYVFIVQNSTIQLR